MNSSQDNWDELINISQLSYLLIEPTYKRPQSLHSDESDGDVHTCDGARKLPQSINSHPVDYLPLLLPSMVNLGGDI